MTIGVIAPSGPVCGPRFDQGLKRLESRGYRVICGKSVYDRRGYLAGSDVDRAADFTAMFARQDVDAIICARGGYGASRMLEYVDWEAVGANPKLFVGYSDITMLHLALEKRIGLVTIYGPMVVTYGGDLSENAEECFWQIMTRTEPFGRYDTGDARIRPLVGGKANGRLAGGCLSLLSAAVGTPEEPDFTGRIVLMEDVGEAIYRVDRLLVQLLRAGLLQNAAGFVIGTVTNYEDTQTEEPYIRLEDVWQEHLVPLGKPTIAGFPFGHEPNPLTLPLGCLAELNADAGTLTVLEPAVR